MPQDGALNIDTVHERPNGVALRKALKTIDPNKVIIWDSADCMAQFQALVESPPLHSLVVHIEPIMAKKLLETTNDNNRRMIQQHMLRLAEQIGDEDYEVTGDTIKFSKSGRCLDGQHRLKACESKATPIISHVVFGLADEVFDVIDQGKKRTAGDVLGMCNVSYPTLVAGAIRWVLEFRAGGRTHKVRKLTARGIREYATGSMKDIADHMQNARQINEAFKQPPTMVAALLYLISRNSRALAEDFAYNWLHGARTGRNKNFDVLNQRIVTVRNQSGGALNRSVNAAMVVQMFNNWNAGVVASPRSLTWRMEWAFPKLEFDGAAFLKNKDSHERADTSLAAQKLRMLLVLGKATDKDGNASLHTPELAKQADIPAKQVTYILGEMERGGIVHCSRRAGKFGPAIYTIKDAGMAQLRAYISRNGKAAA